MQEEGAEVSKAAIELVKARCIGAGLLVTMAARINPHTSMHATNKPRRIIVSNFMSVSPFREKGLKALALESAIPVPTVFTGAIL